MNISKLLIFIGLICLVLTGCNKESNIKAEYGEPQVIQPAEPPIHKLSKTIPVTVTNVSTSYYNTKSHDFAVKVTVKSEEYGLEKTYNLQGSNMGSAPYAYEIYIGQIRAGSIINADMYSWVKEDQVLKRELNNLVR
jgi:hypothetical protein